MAEPVEERQEREPGQEAERREPRGFGEHTRRSSGEHAHEQGWGLNEDERRRLPGQKQNHEGGTDYDYGARDFGDAPVDTSAAQASRRTLRGSGKTGGEEKPAQRANQRTSARRG